MNSNEIFILIGVFGLGYFLGNGALDNKDPQVEVKIEQIDTSSFLTVQDLKSIYACVDTKIHNQNNKAKFPCVSVRGDYF